MKMNVEIDLDWLEEDEGIEEQIKEKLISDVVAQCLTNLTKTINEKAASKLDNALDGHIGTILSTLLDREIKIADKYGTIKKTYKNINEMLDEKFDTFLTSQVDKEGKPYNSCSYGDSYTRIDYLIDAKIRERAKIESNTIVKDTETKINNFFKKELSDKVAERLLKQINIKSLLQENA